MMSLEPIIFAMAAPSVVEILKGIVGKALEKAPAVIKTATGLELQRPDGRLSMGVTKREGKDIATVLVERPGGRAMRKALKMKEDLGDELIVEVTGRARSLWPRYQLKEKESPKLRPGLSIGHFSGFAGSIGCLVKVRSGAEEWFGIASASHVLAMCNTAKKGDAVLKPGFPDAYRVRKNRIGRITNFTYLVHHHEVDIPGRSINTDDVAVVRLDDQKNCPTANLVPNPKDIDKKIKLKGCLSDRELIDRMSEPVFKVGRTTGFREGIFVAVTTKPHMIELPDHKGYLYQSTLVVSNKEKKAFSQDGDSGSLVYTSDGKGVGLIIGASDKVTYLSPLFLCLEAMDAELLT